MNSVIREVNSDTIANEIRMHRAYQEKSVLLVEGSTDARLFKKFTTHHSCEIVVCFGRGNLLEVATILDRMNFDKVLGVCDKDFSDFIGFPEYQGFIVFSDNNDIEIDIIVSPALDNFLAEFGSDNKVAAVKLSNDGCVSNFLFSKATPIGKLRVSSKVHNWNMNFRDMKFRFESSDSPNLNLIRTIRQLIGRTENWCGISEQDVLNAIDKMPDRAELKEFCQGHDIVRILGRSLRKVLGSTNEFNDERRTKTLEQILRLSYEYNHFQMTKMYKAIRTWEKLNETQILKPVTS